MAAQVKARYENGVLTPLEPLDLEDGAEVTVSVDGDGVSAAARLVEDGARPPDWAPAPEDGAPKAGKALLAMVEQIKELHKSIPPEELDKLPTDFSKNKKRYLYGHPKEEE